MLKDAFQQFKSALEPNKTFAEIIQARHASVRNIVQNNSGARDTKLIGSLARQTRIQPRVGDAFDIDVLVIMGEFNQWAKAGTAGLTPDTAINNFISSVQKSERLAQKNPHTDKPTVTVPYADKANVELVPAYLDKMGVKSDGTTYRPSGRAYWVPKGDGWQLADYDYDAQLFSERNRSTDGWLIPSIKMIKSIKRKYFPDLPSFYFDILAYNIIPLYVNAYKTRSVIITFPDLIRGFFDAGQGAIGEELALPGSLTPPVAITQQLATSTKEMFTKLFQYCDSIKNLSETEQQRKWRDLVGDPFPSI